MLHLLLLGLDEICSGRMAVKWDLVYSDAEMSWRALHPDGSSLPKEKATCCLQQEGLEGCGSLSDHSRWDSEWILTELQLVR